MTQIRAAKRRTPETEVSGVRAGGGAEEGGKQEPRLARHPEGCTLKRGSSGGYRSVLALDDGRHRAVVVVDNAVHYLPAGRVQCSDEGSVVGEPLN